MDTAGGLSKAPVEMGLKYEHVLLPEEISQRARGKGVS